MKRKPKLTPNEQDLLEYLKTLPLDRLQSLKKKLAWIINRAEIRRIGPKAVTEER